MTRSQLIQDLLGVDINTLSDKQLRITYANWHPVPEDFYDDYFKYHGVYKAKAAILGILNNNGDLLTFREIINGNIELPTYKQLVEGHSDEIIMNLGISMKSVKEISELTISDEKGVCRGKIEILYCLFAKDINKYNNPDPDKHKCDINIHGCSVEAKGDKSRLNNQCERFVEKATKYIKNIYGDDYKITDAQKHMKHFINNLLIDGVSYEKILTIIGTAIGQVTRKKNKQEILILSENETDEFIKTLVNHKDTFFTYNTKTKTTEPSNLKIIWGLFDSYVYQNKFEPFDELLMFKYLDENSERVFETKVFDKKVFESFESIFNNFCPYVTFMSFPKADKRECAMQVVLK